MRFLYRFVAPAVTLSISLLSAIEGDYIISLSAAVILGLICYNLMDIPPPKDKPQAQPIPDISRKGPTSIHFNDTDYPDWLETVEGDIYQYYGVDSEEGQPNRLDSDGLVYLGVRYTLAQSCAAGISESFS